MSEWKEDILENLVFVDKEQLSNSTDGEYSFYYVDIGSVSTNNIQFPDTPITFRGSPSRARKILHDGDVLMATVRPNLKAFAKFIKPTKRNYIASTGFAVFSKKENADLDYIYYSLFSNSVEKQIETLVVGSNYPALNTSDIRKLKILIPSLLMQRQISYILSTCDAVIEKTQAAIAKYKAIKQGMLHDLFTRGIDITTGKLRPKYEDAPELYKESTLGMVPRGWKVERLDFYFDFLRSGLSRLLSDEDIGVPVLISGNIQENQLDFSSLKYWHIDDPQGADTNSYVLSEGDILLCFINSIDQIGKAAIFEKYFRPCIYTTNLFRVKSSRKAKPKFLYYLLCSGIVQNEIKAILKPAVNQASFTTKDFCKIPVPKISEKEQISFIRNLEQSDQKIHAEQTYLHKLQSIKQALMSDLLSGNKRVPLPPP